MESNEFIEMMIVRGYFIRSPQGKYRPGKCPPNTESQEVRELWVFFNAKWKAQMFRIIMDGPDEEE